MENITDKLISVEEARQLQSNWVEHQGAAIEKSGLRDVRDFLFKLEELQEYINFVRERSKEQGVENPGIRFYFGAYAAEKENAATIFLSPTMNPDGVKPGEQVPDNYEISPLNTIQGGWPPMIYKE